MTGSRQRLLVTVDVEGASRAGGDRYRSVDRLDAFLARLRVPATLFVTPDVVAARTALVDDWLDRGHDVGLHVHPSRITGGSDWLCEYDRAAIEGLVAHGTRVFEELLGVTPRLFRAGRWAYSDDLLPALGAQGYDRDASLRPSEHTDPFARSGVEEYPVTVYSNGLLRLGLRGRGVDAVALHADGYLESTALLPAFYLVAWRLLRADRPYLMISFHDYDLVADRLAGRIGAFLERLLARTRPVTLGDL